MLQPWRCVAALVALVAPSVAYPAGCEFDVERLAFAGTPLGQAACLLRSAVDVGVLEPPLDRLPPNLAFRIGREVVLSRDTIRQYLAARGLTEAGLGGALDAPLSQAWDGAADAATARYFVIHDTSTPFLGKAAFPADLDNSDAVNGLGRYRAAGNEVAHLFINRRGETLVGHDLSVPWRATKLESMVIGTAAKGLFIHVELVQPRRHDPNVADRWNRRLAPDPGFSAAQYHRLALVYIMASTRAGTWLIPAFHAAIDEGLPDGHDDPYQFSLRAFDDELGRILRRLR
jgi:hypothetical protein